MIIKRFFEPLLAQASYLVGCGATGQAIVIDPNRDTETYVAAAAADQLRITYVTETHIHADFLSGSRQLASRIGAALLLSDEGDADWKYQFAREGRLIRDGDRVTVGNVAIDVVHTPGHTPEHLSFVITDGAVANAPIAAATGDFIFVGDVGRPDLLERAANMKGTMEAGAKTLYRSLQRFNQSHEEWLQIWPGHGAGSSCGKGISAVPHSTLGYERRFNWAFRARDEADFVSSVLAGQPDPPKYFATMKRMNKEGPRVLEGHTKVARLDDADLAGVLARGELVIDTRPAADFAARVAPGSLNLPLTSAFVTWAGWLLPYDRDIHLVIGENAEGRLPEIVRALSLIGLDRVAGYFAHSAIDRLPQPLACIPQITPAELQGHMARPKPAPTTVIDVRNDAEWAAGHLPAAIHIPLGHLEERLSELPRGHALITQCRSGGRSAIAASYLRRAGFTDVSNLAGGLEAWESAGLPKA